MERDEAITSFMGITGSDHSRAKRLLESCSWDVNQAVALHFADSGSDTSAPPPLAQAENRGSNEGGEDDVRAALPSKRMRMRAEHDPYADVAVDFRQGRTNVVNPFAGYSSEKNSSTRNFAQMYAPPRKILYSGDFAAAKRTATKLDRWLLVNIQNLESFASHQLNRDTWKDDVVRELITYNCVFWQSDISVIDAAKYMNLYNVPREGGIPHIAMIDPVTGAKMWSLTGFIDPDAMMTKLSDFFEKYPSPTSLARRPPPVQRTPAPVLTHISSSGGASATLLQNPSAHEAIDDGFSPSVFTNSLSDGDSLSGSHSDSDSGSSSSSDSDSDSSDNSNSDESSRKDKSRQEDQSTPNKSAVTLVPSTSSVGTSGAKPSSGMVAVVVQDEPPPSKETTLTMQIKFPDGRAVRRRFLKDRPVDDVFHYAAHEMGLATLPVPRPAATLGDVAQDDNQCSNLEIMLYPRKNLAPLRALSFTVAGLRNSVVTVRLLQ